MMENELDLLYILHAAQDFKLRRVSYEHATTD